jgi:hypothetical protein
MIHFVTSYTRKQNLPVIYSSIINQVDSFQWHLIEGSNTDVGAPDDPYISNDSRVKYYKIETNYRWGYEQRNFFMKSIESNDEDWCYFLDDDNTVTWDLIDTLTKESLKTDLVLFSQKAGMTEKVRLFGMEDRLSLGNCDIGSFAARYRLIKNTEIYAYLQNGDGHYCEFLNSLKKEDNFKFYLDKYVRYNTLSFKIW